MGHNTPTTPPSDAAAKQMSGDEQCWWGKMQQHSVNTVMVKLNRISKRTKTMLFLGDFGINDN